MTKHRKSPICWDFKDTIWRIFECFSNKILYIWCSLCHDEMAVGGKILIAMLFPFQLPFQTSENFPWARTFSRSMELSESKLCFTLTSSSSLSEILFNNSLSKWPFVHARRQWMKTMIVNGNKITTKLIHAAFGTWMVVSDCSGIFSLAAGLLEEPLVVFSGCLATSIKTNTWKKKTSLSGQSQCS